MNERKWTPGPWMYSPVKSYSGTAHVVLTVDGDFMISESYDGSDDQDAANAHLIAAAPELYEAIKGLLGSMVALMDDPSRMDEMSSVIAASMAIAKAEGKT